MARSRKQLRGINKASKMQTKAKKAKQKKKSKKLTPEVVRCLEDSINLNPGAVVAALNIGLGDGRRRHRVRLLWVGCGTGGEARAWMAVSAGHGGHVHLLEPHAPAMCAAAEALCDMEGARRLSDREAKVNGWNVSWSVGTFQNLSRSEVACFTHFYSFAGANHPEPARSILAAAWGLCEDACVMMPRRMFQAAGWPRGNVPGATSLGTARLEHASNSFEMIAAHCPTKLQVQIGDKVTARFGASSAPPHLMNSPARSGWYAGTVTGLPDRITASVVYDDGDTEERVLLWFVRVVKLT